MKDEAAKSIILGTKQINFTKAHISRFWEKVQKSGDDECWDWIGGTVVGGYGQISITKIKLKAPRVAYALTKGDIPEGLCICHSCDRPLCCNPAHLWMGTHQENNDDKMAKGREVRGDAHWARQHPEKVLRGERASEIRRRGARRGDQHHSKLHPEVIPRGENHWMRRNPEKIRKGAGHCRAKLTEADVLEIRRLYAEKLFTQTQIGDKFSIDQTTVSDICRRKVWTHL